MIYLRILLLAAAMLGASLASAQTIINSLPYTISLPGKYQLGASLVVSSSGIDIKISDVDLDLNGNLLSGSSSTVMAITVNKVANVSVHNGLISGCGVALYDVVGCVVENLKFNNGATLGCYGVAPGTLIRNNIFTNLGDPKFVTAITTNGGVRIENNLVTAANTGIFSSASDFSIGNTVSNCTYGIVNGKRLNNLTFNCTTPFIYGVNASGNN